MNDNFARIVVRPGMKGSIIGFNIDLLQEGKVYEIRDIFDGSLSVSLLGESPLSSKAYAEVRTKYGFSNANDTTTIMQFGGRAVMTTAELDVLFTRQMEQNSIR